MLRLLGGVNKADGAEQKARAGRQRGRVHLGTIQWGMIDVMVGESAGAVNDLRGGRLWTEGAPAPRDAGQSKVDEQRRRCCAGRLAS